MTRVPVIAGGLRPDPRGLPALIHAEWYLSLTHLPSSMNSAASYLIL
jgi:hypothetical protein